MKVVSDKMRVGLAIAHVEGGLLLRDMTVSPRTIRALVERGMLRVRDVNVSTTVYEITDVGRQELDS